MALRPVMKSKTVLNHVLNLQRFSLPNYLRFARPWARESDHLLRKVVFGIAQIQHENAARVGELLVERHASARPGNFPTRFTGLNDVSVRYAAPHVVEDLERAIHEMRWCVETLEEDPPARNIVQAILRDEQRHLQILREELDHVREGETLGPPPTTALKPSIPTVDDFYGDALDRWTNEGGALGDYPHAVRFSRSRPQIGLRSELEPAPALALHV